MRTSKKIVSLVLAVMMVVSMMVVGAVSASAYANIGELDAAIRAGGTITLDQDYTYNGTLYVPSGKTVTLDLAGYTLKSANSNGIRNDGTLTIKDTVGTGAIVAQEACVFALGPKARTTINSGTYTTVDNAVFMGNGTPGYDGNTWTINGGTFNGNITSAGYVACGIYAPNNDTWNVKGGTFNVNGGVGICQRAGKVNVSGNVVFNVTGDGTTGKVGDSRVVVPSGTAIVYDSKAAYPAQTDAAKTTVSGGTFNTDQTPVVQVKADGDATRVTTTGGTFDKEVAEEFIDPIYEYDDATDTVVAKTDLTPVWEWVEQAAGSSYRYKLKLTLKDGETEVYSKEYYPSIVVDGNDFKYVYSTSSNAVKVAGVSYDAPTKYANANGVIMTSNELSKAALAGGSWKLGQDITGVGAMKIADGFKLDGQNYMIKSGTVSTMNRCMFEANTATTKYEFKNVTLDGNKLMKWALAAHTTSGGNNAGNVIDLDTVTIQNFKSNDYVGAINAFGSSTWNLTNCTIVGNTVKATTPDEQANTGAAVWAGAKATVNINGGTYDEILLHGGTANVTVDGGADVDTIRFGYTKATEDSTKTKAVINDGTVGEVVSYTEFVAENVDMDPDNATVGAPAGYEWVDSTEEAGMKTLVLKDDDFMIMGYQAKIVKTSESKDADGNDINAKGVRILTKVNDATAADTYGYVVAKVTGKEQATANFANLKKDGGNGEKTIDCTGSTNSGITGVDNTYVTLAVNGMSAGDQVAVRFFYVKDGVTHYANYVNTVTYDGIIATMV